MADRVRKGTSKAKATTKTAASATTKDPSAAKARKPATAAKRAAETNGATVTAMRITHQQVAELAHRFWTERGGVHGFHEDDWFRAEQELHARAS
jgi:hypothetical protein